MENDKDETVSTYAAFALGEIESIKGADAIIKVLRKENSSDRIRTFAVEAAGKIAAANAKDEKSKLLGEAILQALEAESKKKVRTSSQFRFSRYNGDFTRSSGRRGRDACQIYQNTIRSNTCQCSQRARPDFAPKTPTKKRANFYKKILIAIVRANAARVLGAAEDKDAFDLLLNAAIS